MEITDKMIVKDLRRRMPKIYEKSADPILICHVAVGVFKRMAEVFIAEKGGKV